MAYSTTGVTLDGSAALFGSVSCTDSRYLYCSFWVRGTISSHPDAAVFVADPVGTYWTFLGLGESLSSMYFEGADATLSPYVYRDYWGHRYADDGNWHHHLFAIDSAGTLAAYYVDDVHQHSAGYNGAGVPTINFNGLPLWVFDDSFGASITGEVADFVLSVGTNIIVGTEIPEATRRLFTTINPDGSIVPADPSGFPDATPVVLFKGDASTFATNAGDGGAFTLVGSLTDATVAVMFAPPTGALPFDVHDPLIPGLDGPEPELAGTGYRSVLQIFHSPTYHPETALLLAIEDEDNAAGELALAAFDTATGTLSDYVLLDYDGPGTPLNWNTPVAPVHWPPASSYIYSVRGEHNLTGDATSTWFVRWNATAPFAFVSRSNTPADKGLSEQYEVTHTVLSTKDGSMILGEGGGSLVAPNVHVKFGMWAPVSNSVSYFRTDDPSFSGRYGTGSEISYILPARYCFDAADHLWMVTSAQLDDTNPIYLDEYSWAVGGGDVTLNHLNRYNITPQVSGHNTWRYFVSGFTFNESTNSLVITWSVQSPSWTYTPQDPTPSGTISNITDSNNEPLQIRITHWSLDDRTQLLEEADSVRLLYADFGGGPPTFATSITAGIMGFAGSFPLDAGDHTMGTWSNQDWLVTVGFNSSSETDAFTKYDINSGVGVRYPGSLWGDNNDSGNNIPGVYTWAGAIYIAENDAFWAVRRGQGVWWGFSEPAASPGPPDGVFQEQILGLGIYYLSVEECPTGEDCVPCVADAVPCGETIEPDCNAEWPFALLQPRSVGIHLIPANIGGGLALAGGNEEVAATANGFWRFTYEDIPIHDRDQILSWRAMEVLLEGRAGVICLHAYEGKRAPWLTVGSPIIAIAASAFAVGATSGIIEMTSGGVPAPGQFFSWEDTSSGGTAGPRLYCLETVGPVSSGDTYAVTFQPPVRSAIAINDPLEFDHPMCRARLADDRGLRMELNLHEHAIHTVDFDEDI